MTYENLEGLPKDVRANLPKYAQQIYLKAYNNACLDPMARHS